MSQLEGASRNSLQGDAGGLGMSERCWAQDKGWLHGYSLVMQERVTASRPALGDMRPVRGQPWGAVCRLAGVYACKWAVGMHAIDGECKLELAGEEGDGTSKLLGL